MVELLGPRVVARAAGRFRALGLDAATLSRARRTIERRLEGGKVVARPALYEALDRAGISTAAQRGLHVLWRLAHDRVVCFGPRDGKQQTFVLFDEWLPRARTLAREEALAELGHRYFAGHGPATMADFAWWSGLSLSDARLAVHLAGPQLETASLDEKPCWFVGTASESADARSRAYLLPAYDEFLVGYEDRSAALDAVHASRAGPGDGIFSPSLLVDGRVVGTWKRRLGRGDVVVSPAPSAALSKPKTRAVALAASRYADFLGLDGRLATGRS
jgi:hypothetical protein